MNESILGDKAYSKNDNSLQKNQSAKKTDLKLLTPQHESNN